MTANWGMPTDIEIDSVLQFALNDSDLLAALKTLYGASADDPVALRRAIKSTMMAGGIRRTDGRKWGLQEPVGSLTDIGAESRPSRRSQIPLMSEEAVSVCTDIESLLEELHLLASTTDRGSSYSCFFEFSRIDDGLMVALNIFFNGVLSGTQKFKMPGNNLFKRSGSHVEVHSEDTYLANVSCYETEYARAMQQRLARLNTIVPSKLKS